MAKALNVSLSVTADVTQARAQLQSLQQNLQQLTANSANLKIGLDTSQLQQASAQVTELGIHLKQAINPETGLLNFAKLNTSIKSSGQSLQDYGAALLRLGPQGQQAFTQLASAVAKAEIPTRRLSSVLGNMGTVLKNTVRWQLSSSLIHGFVGSIQQAFGYAKDLNKSLTDIQIVTQASDEHMARFAEQANKSAKALNTTTTAYTKASLIYYQQGLNDQQVKERTDVTVKMANITGQSAQVVSDQLTAIWNNFAKGGENLEYYADVITALGAATASSSEEISKGLSKFASIADTVGLSYENATAALATITATTRQSADTVGTGLRTLFSRLQSLSLGETLEDGVDLTKYSKALDTIGVQVLDAGGNLRKMDDILADMGEKWQGLTNAQKTALAQTVGGVRQYTTLMALMEHFDFYEQNQQVARNAEGTVQHQADIYAKSWEASQKRVKASAEAIYSDLINDQFFIGLNNGFSSFLNILDNIIDGLGGLKGLLSTIGALSLKLFSKEATQGLVNFSKNLQTIFMSSAQAQAKQTQFLDFAASQMAGLGASEDSIQFAKQQIKLQQDYVKNAAAMDETSRLTYQTYVDNYERNRLDYLNIEQKIAQSKKSQDIISSNLWSSSANGGYQDAQIKQLKDFVKKYNATLEQGIGNITGDQYQKMQSYLQQGRVQWVNGRLKRSYFQAPFELNRDNFNQALSTQIEEPLKKFPEYEKILKDFTGDVGDLATKLSATDMDKNMIAQITKAYESGGLDGAVKAFHQLNTEQIGANVESFAKAWGVSTERVQQYVNEVQAAQGDTQKLAEIRRQMDQDITNANKTLGKENSQVQTAQGITQMAQGLMGIASAASALNSIVDTIQRLNDGTMSASEGILALGTSLSTALMMGVMGFNGLTAAAKTLSITISSGPLLGISLALMALPLVIRGLDALIETQEEKTQRLQEELEQTSNWAQQAQNASQDLLEAQGAHNNLLDEINSLTQGTAEFYNAVIRANSAARGMIEQYHLQQGQDFYYDSNGAIRFTQSGTTTMESQAQAAVKQSAYQQIATNMEVEANQLGNTNNIRENLIKKDLLGNSTYLDAVGGTDNEAFDLFIKDYNDYIETLAKNEEQFNFNKYMSHLRETNFGGQFTEDELKEYLEGTNFSKIEDFIQTFTNKMSSTLDFSSLFNAINLNENLGLNDLQVSFAESLFENTISAEQFQAKLEENEKAINKSGESLQNFYAEVLGFYPDKELAKDEAQMKKQIAKAQTIAEYSEQLRTLGGQSQNLQKYSDYKDVSMTQLSNYIAQAQTEGASGEFAAAMMQAYYNSTAKNVNEKLTDLGLRSISTQSFYGPYNGAPTTQTTVTGLSIEDLNTLGMSGSDLNSWMKLQSQASQLFGEGSDFANNLGRTLITEGNEFKRGLQNALLNVDWSNQLSATLDLARMSKQATEAGMSIAGDLTSVYEEAFSNIGGKTGILEQMYKTEEFQDALKSLQKQFKKTGKIGAQEIEDAAESCDILNETLEYGELSAGALGDALSLMSMGAIGGIGDISEALWAALEAANAFEDSLANAFEYIDNFGNTLSRSTQDLSDFFSKYSKDMFALLGEGNVGGERLYQEASAIWGQKYSDSLRSFFISQETGVNKDDPYARQKAYNERYGQFDSVMQQVQKTGNLQPFWSFMLNPKNNASITDIMGRSNILSADAQKQLNSLNQQINNNNIPSAARDSAKIARNELLNNNSNYKTIQEALEDIGITQGKNEDIEVDVRGRTTDQMREQLMQAMNLTKDQADLYLQELAGHGAFLTQDLKTNDFMAGYNSFLDENGNIKSDMAADARAFLQSQGPQNFDLMKESLERQAEAQKTQIDKLQAKETAGILSDDEAKTLANLRDAAEETATMQENLDNAKQSMEDLANDTKLFEETSKEGVLDWENVSKTTKDALKNIAEQSKVTVKREVQSPYGGGAKYTTTTDSYDVDTIIDKAQKMGMSQEQAFEAVKKTAQSAGAEISRSWEDSYHNIHTYSQKAEGSLEEFEESYRKAFAADKHRENAEFGKDLFKGFIEAAEEAQLTADGLDLDLDAVINVTSEGLDVVKSDLEAVEGDHPATIAVSEDGVAAKTKDELDSIPGTYTGTVTIGGNYGVASTTASALASIPGTYDATVNITVNEQGGASGGGIVSGGMSGYISRLSERIKAKHSHALGGLVGSYAIGSANRQLKPGLSLTAEEGPEIIWNKQEGYSYVVGGNGHPEFVVLRPGDRVFNANQTREILNHDKPDSNYFSSILDPKSLDQRLFGSFAAGNGSVYGSYGPNSRYGGASGAANQKEKDYTPERYHVITRQIQDLTFWYEELKKARENAYGTNILDHIDEELKGTEELIKAQEALVKEAEHYREIDLQRIKDLGINFELDENGNIRNWEELQEKYRKAAEQNKDDTAAKERWDAIQQYEETLDKWQEAYAEFTDLRLQAAELSLERITTKAELKIDFDERDLKLIEHFTKKIDDNIYDTARVLQLAGLSLDKINDKIDTTRQGINEIFENMTDSKGNQITDMTLEKFLSLSEAERDALDINHDFGKQLEEYSDDLLDYVEELEEFKTKGINELNEAFDELNDNIQSSMDLFNYYQDTLDNLKNIIDLQGVTISKDLRDVFQTINQTLLSNNANNIQSELVRYEKLRDVVTDLQNKLLTVTDPTLQKEWENQLKEAEEALRDSQTNLLTLWQDGLDMAKQVFEQNIDNAVREFEEQIAGAYGDLNGLQAAYDRRKEIDNFYVDDYEKYYQISKLQRQINKDLNDAEKNHNKNVKGLNILFNDLNNAREAGVELTAYDLDIFAKRYAYEKALMDLEESRNARQQVRLQRDANGNWGYVYTAAEDDDDLVQKQQAVEDALYEWQKATTEEANRYSDEILPKIRANLEAIAEAYKTGSDIPQNILNDTKELLSLWGPQFQKSLEDGAQTLDIAIDRYNNTSFDILDNLNESGLAAVLETGEGIDQLLDILISQMDTANDEMNTASMNYKNQIDNLNNFFKEYGDSLGTVINAWAQAVGEDSEKNKANTTQMIDDAKLTFDKILLAANEFEDKFMEKYEPIISRNEQFIIALNEALDALNRKEFVQGQLLPYIGSYIDPSSFASGGFTGAWGSGGRLAVLHEKENVFNAEDTSRLLSASQILRTIDLSINSFAAGFGNILLPNLAPIGNSLDQNVHIDATFPNVTNHNEIELAFDNLINKASQYANRKNMSSMTFQDMYTSKF